MPTPFESREALKLVTGEAVDTSLDLLTRSQGSPEVRRAGLLEGVSAVVGHYSLGSAALAADFYEEERELARVRGGFVAEPVVLDRTVKLRRGIAWASDPLFEEAGVVLAASRLAEVVQLEVARPYRDTITTNRRMDPESVGWRRITAGGCKFCRMLAANGAVYRHDTARFAAHTNCHCTAQPVFKTDVGEEASALQYVASKRKRTDEEKERLRDHLNTFFPDFPG